MPTIADPELHRRGLADDIDVAIALACVIYVLVRFRAVRIIVAVVFVFWGVMALTVSLDAGEIWFALLTGFLPALVMLSLSLKHRR